ncbi:MAG: fibronectin type III domain-containing protein [Jiangellaceae bacterium]
MTEAIPRRAAIGLASMMLVAIGPEPARDEPTPEPDRIVLTATDDPATSQAVTWRTSADVVAAGVEVRPVAVNAVRSVEAEPTAEFVADGFGARSHTARLDDLSPGTTYTYRVGDGTRWSDWTEFTTAADTNEPFTFVYVGDAQTGLRTDWAALVERAVADEPAARVWLHAGDLVNDPDSDAEWGAWFDGAAPAARTAVMLAAAGNHDQDGSRVSRHWRPQFVFPANGPDGVPGETVYYVDYQGVRFVVLNSNVALQAQTAWLADALGPDPNPWTVVLFHHPVFSTAEHRDNPEVRDAWLDVLEEHDVDLVLQGHDHTYGRGQRSDNGPVYVVAVAGSTMYDLGDAEQTWGRHGATLQHATEDQQSYQVIDVDGDTLRYESRTLSGEVQDAFRIVTTAEGRRVVGGR